MLRSFALKTIPRINRMLGLAHPMTPTMDGQKQNKDLPWAISSGRERFSTQQ